MFKSLIRFFKALFKLKGSSDTSVSVDDTRFRKIIVLDSTPNIDLIGYEDFIFVQYNQNPYWALFKCPCGCNSVISLPLQNNHNPKWTLKESENGHPTLNPSIWQNKGCFSHFWISDGKVQMCGNTGIEPWKAEPAKYSKSY